ncbi:FGFR1 oncoprotein partner [Borealophlyctis nickersoniae]|nr:FGFR1 oncoprotein partner [Borealophlyctis nickersoniae]
MATLSPTSPKTTEEIESLKSLVSDTLLKRGVLGKIKAQLRASVFAVLQESEEGKRLPSENSKVQALRDTGAGQLAFDLVWDFLQYLDLEYTLAVFKPEASLNKPESSPIDAAAIAVDLDLPESTGSEKPLLLRMLESRMSQKREGATAPKNKVGRRRKSPPLNSLFVI